MSFRPLRFTLAGTSVLVANAILSLSQIACTKDADPPCSHVDFFNLYEQNEAANYDEEGNLILNLRINSHYPDCGAPDCFGHDMEIRVEILRSGDGCRIVKAISRNTTFVCEKYIADSLVAGIPPVNHFYPLNDSELSSPGLTEIALYDEEHNQALFLRRGGYSFYEQGMPKEEERDLSKWDGESEWNFPATGSDTRWWGME